MREKLLIAAFSLTAVFVVAAVLMGWAAYVSLHQGVCR